MTEDDARTERDWARYQALLAQGRQTLREKFTDQEAGAVLDALNGLWFPEPSSVRNIAFEVNDAIQLNGLEAKWAIHGPALLHTLQGLTWLESMALADAVERWWSRVGTGEIDLAPSALWDEA